MEANMKNNPPKFTKEHFEFVADFFGPLASSPSQITQMADALVNTNITFDRKKFEDRATGAWEAKYADDIADGQRVLEDTEVRNEQNNLKSYG